MNRGLLRVSKAGALVVMAITMLSVSMLPSVTQASDGPDIKARHAVVIDAESGQVLFDKDMDAVAAPASLTKVFTAAVAMDSAQLDTVLTVDGYDLVGEASMGLYPGAELTLRTLLYGMLLPSGNDAAMVIARNLGQLPGETPQQSINRFMERTNATAARLGLEQTSLSNPHGLDQAGHHSSARDIAAITMYAMKNDTFRQIIGAPYYQAEGYELYQANRLLNSAPGVIGGKTGITDAAGYCLVEVAQRDGRTVIAVLLGSTAEAWYADASALLDHGFETLAAGTVPAEAPTIRLAPVAPGVSAAQPTVASNARTDLKVDLVGDTMAVVRPVEEFGRTSGWSWGWPIASFLSMGAALALILSYPAILGLAGLLFHQTRNLGFGMPVAFAGGMGSRGPASASSRNRRPHHSSSPVHHPPARTTGTDAWRPHAAPAAAVPPVHASDQIVRLNAAETIAARAVRMSERSDYHAAMDEFMRALRTEPGYDLSRCSGFWTMPTGGYVAAARAYEACDRTEDARSLLTIVKLSYGSYYDVRKAVDQALQPKR